MAENKIIRREEVKLRGQSTGIIIYLDTEIINQAF